MCCKCYPHFYYYYYSLLFLISLLDRSLKYWAVMQNFNSADQFFHKTTIQTNDFSCPSAPSPLGLPTQNNKVHRRDAVSRIQLYESCNVIRTIHVEHLAILQNAGQLRLYQELTFGGGITAPSLVTEMKSRLIDVVGTTKREWRPSH